MFQRLSRTPRRVARALIAAAALATAAGGVAAPAHAALPTRAQLDGPGRLYAIRTFDSGAEGTPAQVAACKVGLGPEWAATQISTLDARYYAPGVNPSTGLVTDPAARQVGPLFGCVGVTGSLKQPGTSFGEIPLSLGTIHAKGRCSLRFAQAQAFATFSGCVLPVVPELGRSGLVTSASYTDLLGLYGTTTGSVWTAFVAGATGPDQTVTPVPVPSAPKPGNVLRHQILRAVGQHAIPVASSGCPWFTQSAAQAALHAQVPDSATSELIAAPNATAAGSVKLCFQGGYGLSTFTTAYLTVPAGTSTTKVIKAEGTCYQREIGLTGDLRSQACDLEPVNPRVVLKEGMITSNGLVHAGDLTTGANAAVWVLGGFGPFGTPDA